MKKRLIKEYKKKLRLILRSKLNGRKKVTAINTWAVAIFRYGAGILSWRVHELNSLDRKTRKIMTMHDLYLTRREGGRGLVSIQHCVRGK